MRMLLLAAIASCTKPTAVAPAHPGPEVTPLEVIVLDDYKTREHCDGIPARTLEISLDGRVVAAVAIPCSTVMRAPPQQFKARVFPVAPGKHAIVVREAATGSEAKLELEFPVIDEHDQLATKLPVWANDDELELQGLRAALIML
jgi:hypothetical protein